MAISIIKTKSVCFRFVLYWTYAPVNNGWWKCEWCDSLLPVMNGLDVITLRILFIFIYEWQSHGYSYIIIKLHCLSVWSRKLLRQHRCGYWQRSRGRLWTLVLSQCAQDTLVALLVWSVSWSRSRVQLDTINGNIMCAQEGGARQHVTIVVRYNSSNCSTHNILTSTIHFSIKM